MSDYSDMYALAYKAERAASRKLAQRAGMSAEEALRVTLTESAGSAGMAALIAARRAVCDAAAARARIKEQQRALARSERARRHYGAPGAWQGWFDGSARPNPGRCGIGALLLGPEGLHIEVCQGAGFGSSSEAEYLALLALLQQAVAAGARELTVYGDSRVVIDDINGSAGASPSLAALRSEAQTLIAQLGGVSLRWLPRIKNAEADALSQRAVGQLAAAASMGP